MSKDMYSVEQVAELLGLHVRTVRGYIRAGRLPAVRIGKQYRIARADLDAFTGRPAPPPSRPALEVSAVARLDGVDRATADRLATLVLAVAATGTDPDPARRLRVQTIHDEERHRVTIMILGDAGATTDLLRLVDAVARDAATPPTGPAPDA